VFEQLSGNIPQFSEVIGFAPDQVTVVAGASSHYAEAEFVTGNFFDGLGVTALVGRMLTAKDDRTGGAAPVAVISYRYWERYLGRKEAISIRFDYWRTNNVLVLASPVLEDLFKTAHPVCPSTDAFLVPKSSFLAKIFAV
jgi:MacB-like protein